MKWLGSRPRRLCIGAIVYNEAPYLPEWIAFHLEQGVEHFFIGDHDSDDGTTALLEALSALGYVTRLFHPRLFSGNAQRNVYEDILRLTRKEPHLVAFLDADEFLLPTNERERVGEVVRELLGPWRNGGLGVNWLVFGSSGRIEPGEGLVIERFTHCNESTARINRHIKSIVKPDCVRSIEIHRCRLNFGYRYVNSAGESTRFDRTTGFARDIEPIDGRLRLHHYVVKSYREFIERKARRGRAPLGPGNNRDRKFFQSHDKSGCVELRARNLASAVRDRLDRLNVEIAAGQHGCEVKVDRLEHGEGYLRGSLTAERALAHPVLICTRYGERGRSMEEEIPLRRAAPVQGEAASPVTYTFDHAPAGSPAERWANGLRLRLFANPAVLRDSRTSSAFPEPAKREAAVSVRDYVGEVDNGSPDVVTGWVRHRDSVEPVRVQLYVNDRLVAAGAADRPRAETVRDHKHPTGRCGFEFRLSELGVHGDVSWRIRVEHTRFWIPRAAS